MSSVVSASGPRLTASIRRELLLSGLNKLEDRDTLKTAVQEINAIIHNLDGQGVTSLVSCLCRVERHQKNYARKECLRLFGSLASPDCPARGVFLSSSILSKTTRFLVQSFQDRDAGVRETAAATFARIAKEWSLYHKELIEGKTTNIFIKRLFKALSDPKKEIQVAASDALSEMSPWLEALDKEAFKDCLRSLKNPQFSAKAHLLRALASMDAESDQPRGVMKSCPETCRPFVLHFIGRQETPQHSGHGLLHLLFNPDWFIRKASVDALRCVALLFSSELLNSQKKTIQKIRERLQRQRFDRVKLVRDAIHQTLELYADLSASLPSVGHESDSVHEVVSLQAPVLNLGTAAVLSLSIGRHVQAVVLREKKQRLTLSPSSVPQNSKQTLEVSMTVRPVSKEAAWKLPLPQSHHILQVPQSIVDSSKQSSCCIGSGIPGHRRTVPSRTRLERLNGLYKKDELLFTSPEDGALNRLREGQEQLDSAVKSVQHRVDALSTSLHGEIAAIKQSLEELPSRKCHDYLDNNLSAVEWQEPLTKDTPPAIAYDLDALYTEALPCRLSLFRLMQRTAPVWLQLSEATREALLESFISQIEEKIGLTRICPWIWQLTQPSLHSIAISLPLSLQEKLQSALQSLRPQELEEHDQIEALLAELDQLWSREALEADLQSIHDFDAYSVLSSSSRPVT